MGLIFYGNINIIQLSPINLNYSILRWLENTNTQIIIGSIVFILVKQPYTRYKDLLGTILSDLVGSTKKAIYDACTF